MEYKYNSLEDFINSFPLSIDGHLYDECCAKFSIKGIVLNATILFADITSFSARTSELSSIENLIFVNNFLGWMSASAIKDSNGIIDKYIGDEIMVVFANEFGSLDHFTEAVQAAIKMIEKDTLNYHPHIGIASGEIIIGYTGTPLKYSCSVFGTPVIKASRCASIKSKHKNSIIFPSTCWKDNYSLEIILTSMNLQKMDRKRKIINEKNWNLCKPRFEKVKAMSDIEVMEIYSEFSHQPKVNATDRAKEHFITLKDAGFYKGDIKKRLENCEHCT